MRIEFSEGMVFPEPEDKTDHEFLAEASTMAFLMDIGRDMVQGPPCGRLTNEEAKDKILRVYRDYLKQKAWEMRHAE